mgnify:CR=1 FL=1
MPFSRLSIQWKITLLAGLCLLVIVTLLVATSLYQARNSAEITALELARAKIVSVDPFEAATKVKEAQTQLEMIYAVTARLSSLSLMEYLR